MRVFFFVYFSYFLKLLGMGKVFHNVILCVTCFRRMAFMCLILGKSRHLYVALLLGRRAAKLANLLSFLLV